MEPEAVDLAVYDFGGTGPDLLLAHATGLHAHVWLPVVDHLQDDFHCVAFDERGHGRSDRPASGDFHWDGFAADALTVVEALGLVSPFGAGHSCGGALLLLAEQSAPGTFSGLWCYEPIVFPPATTTAPGLDAGPSLADGARHRRETFASRAEARERYAAKPPFAVVDPAALDAYVEHGFEDLDDGTVRLLCRGADEASVYGMGRSHSGWDRLGEIGCPVTVAGGGQEPRGPAALLPLLAERLPRGRVEVLSELGHFGPLQDPEAIAASIRKAFLGA